MKYKNYYTSILSFMLMFPFRLPISVALIYFFNWTAGLAGSVIPDNIMAANIIISKMVYNIIFGSWLTISAEKLFRQIYGRFAGDGMNMGKDQTQNIYVWTVFIGIIILAYIIYDCFASYELFYSIIGKPIPQL